MVDGRTTNHGYRFCIFSVPTFSIPLRTTVKSLTVIHWSAEPYSLLIPNPTDRVVESCNAGLLYTLLLFGVHVIFAEKLMRKIVELPYFCLVRNQEVVVRRR